MRTRNFKERNEALRNTVKGKSVGNNNNSHSRNGIKELRRKNC